MLTLGVGKEDWLGVRVGRRVHGGHVGDVGHRVGRVGVLVEDRLGVRVRVHGLHHVLLLVVVVGAVRGAAGPDTLLVVDGGHGSHHLMVLLLRLTHGLQVLWMELLMLLLMRLLLLQKTYWEVLFER